MAWQKRWLVIAALTLSASALAWLLHFLPIVRTIEWKLYDLRARHTLDPRHAPANIVLVEIDEDSLRDLAPLVGRWPWPRVVHSRIIDFLARGPARVIAYDVLFAEPDRQLGFELAGETWTGEESDRAFVESVRRAGTVVSLADAVFQGSQDAREAADEARAVPDRGFRLDDTIEDRPDVLPPFGDLAGASLAIGHNYFVLDDDGPVRRTVPFVRSQRVIVPSLSMAAFLAAERIDPRAVSIDDDGLRLGDWRLPLLSFAIPRFEGDTAAQTQARHALIRFRGPRVQADGTTPTYRTYSSADLLLSEEQIAAGEKPRVDPAAFKDALVFVGVTGSGLLDVFATPLGGARMPGSQIHATVVDQLLSQRWTRPVPLLPQVLTLLACAGIVAFITVRARLSVGLIVTLLTAGVLGALAWALFARGWWLSAIEPAMAIALTSSGGLSWQYFVEGREKRKVKALFSRYLSKDVYEQVLANPKLAELGGDRRVMSVLFSDVRGFTALSERGDPAALVTQLNEYFSRMVDVVFAHQGTLDKFVGDMVMALFGAPLPDADHADHAVQTALAMVTALDELNARWRAEGRPTLGIGIGVNSGDMIAGNIGAESVRSYTVIGDAVNLGARLESLNKDYATTIIISEHTAKLLKERYNLRPLGPVTVKGKSVAVEIFALTREAPPSGDRSQQE